MNGPTQQEEMLFDAARQLAHPAERQEFLERACADNVTLRARVEGLLASQAEADRFFDEGVSALGSFVEEDFPEQAGVPAVLMSGEKPGTRIGRYKLLEKIGEGGCGVVYMAEQEEPVRRRVALKVIKLGMDTKSVIARFEAERQALAMMDHTNIARVLDAGATETGRPYFVMELVRGFKITEYCDQNNLDTRRRLQLFIKVCHAIQHAHQKGIIHRDIKPSNILVTLHDGVPVPKVIDFGIAKATETRLTDKTLFTSYAQIIGTPAYMSPEQAEMSGLDVDTRSDLYSLGVLLYELLTGKTPFDSKELMQSGVDRMRRTLRETEPQRPSKRLHTLTHEDLTATAHHRHAEPPKLISQLQGDLDWIVMKALEKDRSRRYETVNGLAMDVERYRNNEPVLARPPSRLYRFRKLVRRNRVVFIATGAVTLTLLIGLGTSTWLFWRERQARQRAVDAELKESRLRAEAERGRANEIVLREQAEARASIVQSAPLLAQQQYDEADQLLAKLSFTQPTLEGAEIFRTLGDWHAINGRYREAEARFQVLIKVNQLDTPDVRSLDYLRAGPMFIEAGDITGFEQFREDALMAFPDKMNPVIAERVIKITLLRAPVDTRVFDRLQAAEQISLASLEGVDESRLDGVTATLTGWRMVSLALMDYRRGNWNSALHWTERCLAFSEKIQPRTATALTVAAMARQQTGLTDQAKDQLKQARTMITEHYARGLEIGDGAQGFWFDWEFARILLEEATALVESKAVVVPVRSGKSPR